MSNPADRRKFPRFPFLTEITLTVVPGDATTKEIVLHGTTLDVSLSGMRVKTHQVSETDYRKVLQYLGNLKLSLFVPQLNRNMAFRGRGAWAEYYPASPPWVPHCLLGISFEQFTKEEETQFQALIAAIMPMTQDPRSSNEILRGAVPLPKLR